MDNCYWKTIFIIIGIVLNFIGLYYVVKREKSAIAKGKNDIQRAEFNIKKTSVKLSLSSCLMLIFFGLASIFTAIKWIPSCDKKYQQHNSLKNHNSFSGVVVEEGTNQSISGAQLNIVGRNEKYYTDDNGGFKITFDDSLIQTRVRVFKPGFKPYDQSFDLPSDEAYIVLQKE